MRGVLVAGSSGHKSLGERRRRIYSIGVSLVLLQLGLVAIWLLQQREQLNRETLTNSAALHQSVVVLFVVELCSSGRPSTYSFDSVKISYPGYGQILDICIQDYATFVPT